MSKEEEGTHVPTEDDDMKDCETNDVDDVEADGWEELMGKDLLLKKLERSNIDDDPVSVQPQDAVIVDFVGRLASDKSDADGPIFHEAENWLLVVGEKDVVPALEMGIRFMGQGETAAVWSHSKYAYGPGQRSWNDYSLPANSAVRYTVTLKRVVPAEEMERRSFKVQLCQSKKMIANDIYKHDDILHYPYAKSRALHVYQRAAEMLDFMLQNDAAAEEDDDDEPSEGVVLDQTAAIRECLLDCLNNIAAVHLRCQSYHAAKQACVLVLEKDPTNFKALLRAAKAALLDPASSYEEVDAAISAAEEQCSAVDHDSRYADVERIRADFQRRKLAHQKREKIMYSKMAKATTTVVGTRSATKTTAEENTPTDNANDDIASAEDKQVKESKDGAEVDDDVDQVPPVVVSDASISTFVSYLKTLPWRTTILPYGIQLLLPFVMYYYFSKMKRRHDDDHHTNNDGSHTEL